MKLFRTLDKYINDVTMYRLLVYGLSTILTIAIIFCLTNRLSIAAGAMIASIVVILTVGYIADRLLAAVWEVSANDNSSLITCLILCCILPPSSSAHHLALLGVGTLIAITSKYLVAYRHKHIFNPAAFGAIVLGLTSLLPATWWIGTPAMLPITIIFGLIVLRKVRRFQLFTSFLIGSLVMTIVLGLRHDESMGYVLKTLIESSPLVFLGTVMLTEPSTSPPHVWQQRIYGLIVGIIFTSQLSFSFASATPEMALIIGNIYAYAVSPKYKLRLRFKRREQLSQFVYDFSFEGSKDLSFEPGQYLEWTLPRKGADRRGNRRTFSIASAPGENEIHIAIKIPPVGSTSSYKKTLMELKPGEPIIAAQLAGDFVLPSDLSQKLIFIAGGIGITPFLSMAKHMIKTNQKRDIVLLYLVSVPEEFCYQAIWQQASLLGLRVIPILSGPGNSSWKGATGYLTPEVLSKASPDFASRRFYLSGPSALVDNYSKLLRQLKIKPNNIVTDHFSGY